MRVLFLPVIYFLAFNICINLLNAQDSLLFYLSEIPDLQIHIDSFNGGSKILDIENKGFSFAKKEINYNPEYAYWFKFSLDNRGKHPTNIKLRAFVYDSLTLITKRSEATIVEQRGLLVKYDKELLNEFQTLRSHKYEFDIVLQPASKQQFYLRIKNLTRFESNFNTIGFYKIETPSITSTIWYLIFSVALSSILLFLSLFMLLHYVQNRDLSYLFYSMFTFLYSVVMWRKFEKSNSFLNWPFLIQPESYYYFEIPITLLTYVSHFLFLMYFINAKKEIPFFFKILRFGIIASISYILIDQLILHTWGFGVSWKAFAFFRFFLIGIAIVTFYFLFKLGSKLTYYLIVGSFFAFIGAALTAYLSYTLYQPFRGVWDISLLPNQIAIILEALFLAIGLGYKSRVAERDKLNVLHKLEEEQKEKEYQQKSKEKLLKWFTNISHEIRTPLTVITGMADNIKTHQKETALIQRNSKHLIRLINQVLDLSKIESSSLQVNNIRGDIIQYLQYLTESFSSMATDKQIMLTFYPEQNHIFMDYDEGKIQHIIYNLLSNAIKFTSEKGKVIVHVQRIEQENKPYLKLKIKDTGIGIPTNQLPHIFDRFYQVDNSNTRRGDGTGIGLTLVYELVQLINGKIKVESQEGKGTSFLIWLPIENKLAVSSQSSEINAPVFDSFVIKGSKKNHIPTSLDAPILLIIEDNKDMITYVESLLEGQYIIHTAKNGQEGIDLAISLIPDLIISDVMMPVKDGYEVCNTLKRKELTSHIPIILLTAKVNPQDKIEGIKYGADSFITKPFHREELIIQVQKLIELRQKLQKKYSVPIGKRQETTDIEEQFLNKLQQLIDENLEDSNFGVSELAASVKMNNNQLYRKVKFLTKKTPSQYIRSIRLDKANELLVDLDLNISEIAYQVGFADPNYFSRVFQQEFGHSPRDFRKKL